MVSGTSALLLHGLGENPDSYQDLATTLAERQLQVSVPRLIEPHEVSTWALTTCTDRIATSMHGEPAHVIGHSLGAVIALDLAQRHLHFVTSLFLSAPQAKVPQALLVLQKLVMQLLPAHCSPKRPEMLLLICRPNKSVSTARHGRKLGMNGPHG